MFYDMIGQERKCGESSVLTYHQLAKYYNDLVVQLRVAETIDTGRIALEVVEAKRTEVMGIKKRIIQLLSKSVLPVLQSTVSYS